MMTFTVSVDNLKVPSFLVSPRILYMDENHSLKVGFFNVDLTFPHPKFFYHQNKSNYYYYCDYDFVALYGTGGLIPFLQQRVSATIKVQTNKSPSTRIVFSVYFSDETPHFFRYLFFSVIQCQSSPFSGVAH